MMEMGHGDELVLADGNFPAASNTQRLVRADGVGVPELLEAILPFFPIDTFEKPAVVLMSVVPGDLCTPDIWDVYQRIIRVQAGNTEIGRIARPDFYLRARQAYAVVVTGEKARYANIILKKGLVTG